MHLMLWGQRIAPGWIAIFFLPLLILGGCAREPLYQSQSYVFGTLVEISIYGENEPRAGALAAHVQQEFRRLHQELHAWQPGALGEINAAFAAGREIAISREMAGILGEATHMAVQSGHRFNPAIGRLVALWGFHRDEFQPVRPDTAAIRAVVDAAPRMTDIVLDADHVRSRNASVQLDLGGYAKGYALDLAGDYLRTQRVKGALVNIGGNILAVGHHGTRHWRVGIQHPRQPGPLATLDLEDGWAIGTSGDYQRYFEQDGRRYCHILDPQRGAPVEGVQAVTVLVPPGGRAGTVSDVASKPIFVAGVGGWREAAQAMGIRHALLVDDAGRLHLTHDMQRRLRWVGKHETSEIVP